MLFAILRLVESLVTYEPNERFLHRMHPLTKVTIFIAVVIVGMLLSSPIYSWWVNAILFTLLATLSAFGGVPIVQEFRARGVFIALIAGIIFFANLIFARGGEGAQYGLTPTLYFQLPPFIYITDFSLNFALSKTFYILNSILAVIMLLKSTRLSDLSYGMQQVGVPYSVAMLTSTSFRCVPMVTDGLLVVYNAQRARGMEMDRGGVRARLRQWSTILTPLMVVLLKWVDSMSIVFQSRGLDFSRRKRTRLRIVPFRALDIAVVILVVGGSTVTLLFREMLQLA